MNEYGSSPRKILVNDGKNKIHLNDHNFNVCVTEEDNLSVSKREERQMVNNYNNGLSFII